MPVLHMETDVVRGVGNQLQQAADLMFEHTQQLNTTMQSLSSNWQGPSADVYISDIHPVLQQLNQLFDAGTTLNHRLQREVDEWEQVDINVSPSILQGSALEKVDSFSANPDPDFTNYMAKFLIKQQGLTCSATSQLMILNALGYDLSSDDVKLAVLRGYNLDSVLNEYGVETEDYSQGILTFWGDRDEKAAEEWLLSRLQNRQGIVVSVEADKLYTHIGGQDNNLPIEGHAVVVAGVEYDESGNIAYFRVLDPAYGSITSVPQQQFIDAWSYRGFRASATKQQIMN